MKVRKTLDKDTKFELAFLFIKDDEENFVKKCVQHNFDPEGMKDVVLSWFDGKSSSDMRENVTIRLAGGIPKKFKKKHGYDGTIDGIVTELKAMELGDKTGNLGNAFSWNDLRVETLDENIKINPYYCLALYCNGKCLVILRYRFNDATELITNFRERLQHIFLLNKNRTDGEVTRCTVTIKASLLPESTEVVYLAKDIDNYKNIINKNIYNHIIKHQKSGKVLPDRQFDGTIIKKEETEEEKIERLKKEQIQAEKEAAIERIEFQKKEKARLLQLKKDEKIQKEILAERTRQEIDKITSDMFTNDIIIE